MLLVMTFVTNSSGRLTLKRHFNTTRVNWSTATQQAVILRPQAAGGTDKTTVIRLETSGCPWGALSQVQCESSMFLRSHILTLSLLWINIIQPKYVQIQLQQFMLNIDIRSTLGKPGRTLSQSCAAWEARRKSESRSDCPPNPVCRHCGSCSPLGWASCLLEMPEVFLSDALSAEAGLYLWSLCQGEYSDRADVVKVLLLSLTLCGSAVAALQCYA